MELNLPKHFSGSVGTVLAVVLALISFVGWLTKTGEKTNDNSQQIQQIQNRMATKDDVEVLRQDIRELRVIVIQKAK